MDLTTNAALLPGLASSRTENASRSGAADAANPVATADFQSFLTLLTAQLRNQDPLQPLDSTQFVAQLASFSTVEQLVGVNDRLDAQAAQNDGATGAVYASWIGRAASAADGRFLATGGEESFPVPAIAGTQRVEAVVQSVTGQEVERFTVATGADGVASWRGANAAGLATGAPLRIELVYHGADSVIDRRPAAVAREITGLRGTEDGPVLELADGGILSPADVATLRAQ